MSMKNDVEGRAMSNCPLCNLEQAESPSVKTPAAGNRPIRFFHRAWRSIQWLFPTAVLALMPKCPICVAAYLALFTGIGVSVETARWIQLLTLALCLCSLAFLAIRLGRRALR